MTEQEAQELEERKLADQNMVDVRSVGFSRKSGTRVQKALVASVTGFAETAMGDVNKWREVIMANPVTLPFKLPPSLQGDIDNLNSSIGFTGLKIPSVDVLETDLKKAIGALAQPTLVGLTNTIEGIPSQLKGQLERLKQLDWLL